MATLKNNEMYNVTSKFVLVGTKEIENWTDGMPFIIALDNEDDFFMNGLEYNDYKDMEIGEIETNLDDYEGLMLIRIR